MSFRMKSTFLTAVAGVSLSALLIVPGIPAYGETHPVDPVPKSMWMQDGRLSVRITSAPLRQIVEDLGRFTGVEVSWLGKGTGRKLSVNLAGLTVEEAFRRILREEGYVFFYTTTEGEEKLARVLIHSRDPSTPKTEPHPELSSGESREDEPALQDGTEEIDEQTRAWAGPIADLLREGRTREATEELKWALSRDRNPQVRLAALEGLSMAGSEFVEEMIEAAMRDPDPTVRAQALRCLELHVDEDPRAREFLESASR